MLTYHRTASVMAAIFITNLARDVGLKSLLTPEFYNEMLGKSSRIIEGSCLDKIKFNLVRLGFVLSLSSE